MLGNEAKVRDLHERLVEGLGTNGLQHFSSHDQNEGRVVQCGCIKSLFSIPAKLVQCLRQVISTYGACVMEVASADKPPPLKKVVGAREDSLEPLRRRIPSAGNAVLSIDCWPQRTQNQNRIFYGIDRFLPAFFRWAYGYIVDRA